MAFKFLNFNCLKPLAVLLLHLYLVILLRNIEQMRFLPRCLASDIVICALKASSRPISGSLLDNLF